MKLGQAAMTGQKLKGGMFTGLHGIYEALTVPAGTIGGQTLYKIGQGLGFAGSQPETLVGQAGARTLRDLLAGYSSGWETQSDTSQ